MSYLIAFIIGYILNDNKILFRMYGHSLRYVKYSVILKDLGIGCFLISFFLSFLKGFLPFIFFYDSNSTINNFLTAFFLYLGYYISSEPLGTEGGEIIILAGIIFAVDYQILQLPLALFIALLILKTSFTIAIFFTLAATFIKLLLLKEYFLVLSSLLVLSKYTTYIYELFLPFKNRIKGKLTFIN
ncbi:MAG: hypothetical protein ACOYVD_05450 [Bacillota bacterium]